SRRRRRRHRACPEGARWPNGSLVEDAWYAGDDARTPAQAHRQRTYRGRLAKRRRAGSGARRAADRPRGIAQQTVGDRRLAQGRSRVATSAAGTQHSSKRRNSHMNIATTIPAAEKPKPDLLTETIVSKLANPATNSDFDFPSAVNDVLKDVGLSTADTGGKLSFYGRDPIIPSPHRFGTLAAIGSAAKAVAIAALWRDRAGEGQDIAVDVRKALRRFSGFYDR